MIDSEWFKDTIKRWGSQASFAAALAKRLDRKVDQPILSRMIRGERRLQLDEARAIAEILDVPLSDVLSRAGLPLPAAPKPVPVIDLKSGAILGHVTPPAPAGTAVKYYPQPGQEWTVFIEPLTSLSSAHAGRLCLYMTGAGTHGLALIEKGRSKQPKLIGLFGEHVSENPLWIAPVVLIQPT